MATNDAGTPKRAVIIGLDGTPFSFLKKEIAAGNLPHLASLFSRGSFGSMETEIPTISSVAWASFMTGKNPGEHGIFGFTDRRPGTYDLYFPNYTNVQSEPVWDRLSREGRRCCIINVPSTYPARALNGVLISGFVAPTLKKAVYPEAAYDYLADAGYRIDVDASKARDSLDLLIEDLHETTRKRREAMLHFWDTEPWDLFMCVFTGTDRLHHFMWNLYEDGDSTYAPEFLRYYQAIDEIIGDFIDHIPSDIPVLMLSDHGFCRIEKEVYLNALFDQENLLTFASSEPRTIADIDPAHTTAYCMDPGRIYLNLQGREPGGIIKQEEAEGVKETLTGLMLGLRDPDSGKSIIERVERREDLFTGPQSHLAPDLVAVPRRGYDLKGSCAQRNWLWQGHLNGMHTHDDAFFFLDDDFLRQAQSPRHIRDLAPLILSVTGVPQ